MQKARQSVKRIAGLFPLFGSPQALPAVAQAGAAAAAGGAGSFAPKSSAWRRKAKSGGPPLAAAGHYCLPVRPGACLAFLWRRAAAANSAAAPRGASSARPPPLPRMAAAAVRRHGQAHARGRVLLGAALPCPGRAGGVYRKGKRYLCACAAAAGNGERFAIFTSPKPGFGPDGKLCRGIRGKGGGAARKARSCRNGVICAGGKIDGYALIARVGDGYGLRRGRRRIAPGDGTEIQQCRGGGDIICLSRSLHRLRFCRRPAWWR